MLLGCGVLNAANFTSAATGNWSNPAIWTINSGTDADGIPDADDNVTINHYIIFEDGLFIPLGQTFTCTVGSGGFLLGSGIINVEGTFIKQGEGLCQVLIDYSGTVKVMENATLSLEGGRIATGVLENNGHVTLSSFQLGDYSGNGMITVAVFLQINTAGGLNYTNPNFNFTDNSINYVYGDLKFVGTTQQTINYHGFINSLTLDNPNNLVVMGGITVENLNLINGKLILQRGGLELNSTLTGVNPDRFISCNGDYTGLRRPLNGEQVFFPVGTSDYTPVYLTGSNSVALVGVREETNLFWHLISGSAYVKKQWEINNQINTLRNTEQGDILSMRNNVSSLKLQWNSSTNEGIGFSTTNARVIRYDYSLEQWVVLPVANSSFECESGICTVTQTDVDLNGTYMIASPSAFFPVSITALNTVYCKNAAAVTLTGTPLGGVYTIDGTVATVFDPSLLSVGNHTVVYTATENDYSNSATQIVTISKPDVSLTGINASYCQQSAPEIPIVSPVGGDLTLDGNTIVTFYPTTTSVGNHILAYSYTDVNGCSNSVAQNIEIIASPNASITGLNANYCVNASPITLAGTPVGGNFTIDGIAATIFDASVLSIGNHTVRYTASVNGCSNSTIQNVAINALPTVSITGLNTNYCSNASPITLVGTPIGGSFTIDGNTATTFDPSVLSLGNHTVIYSVTVNGCSNSVSQTVTINALSTVSITSLNPNYCSNAAPITLIGAPTGGTFTIDGNTTTVFDPSVLSLGNHTVIYSVTVNGCSNSVSQTVTVQNCGCQFTVSLPTCKTVYIGYQPAESIVLTPIVANSVGLLVYKWSNNAITSSITVSPRQTTPFTVTVTDANNCTAIATTTVQSFDVSCTYKVKGKSVVGVTICPSGRKGLSKQLCVESGLVSNYLANGYLLGSCNTMPCERYTETPSIVNPIFNKNNTKYDFTVYPNPAQTEFTIDFSLEQKTNVNLSLNDMNGRIWWSKTIVNAIIHSETMFLKDLPSGIYLVKIAPIGEEIQVKRLIITK